MDEEDYAAKARDVCRKVMDDARKTLQKGGRVPAPGAKQD